LVMAVYGGDDLINSDGGDDLVVGGDGSDEIFGGAGDDMISGDSYGWLVALLGEDCLDINCDTAAQFLDFFCCIESECFKDEFQVAWEGNFPFHPDDAEVPTTYTFLDGGNDDNGENGGIPSDLYDYFYEQAEAMALAADPGLSGTALEKAALKLLEDRKSVV